MRNSKSGVLRLQTTKNKKNRKFSIRSFKNIAQSKDLRSTSKSFRIVRFAKFTRKYKFPLVVSTIFYIILQNQKFCVFQRKTPIGNFAPTAKNKTKQTKQNKNKKQNDKQKTDNNKQTKTKQKLKTSDFGVCAYNNA